MSRTGDGAKWSPPSRREFLKTSAGTLSLAAVGALSLERSSHAAGSDTLKVGLIGCGYRGRGAANEALGADPKAKLIALADIFSDRVKLCRNLLAKSKPKQMAVDDDHCFTGLDGYRKVIESGVDVVVIACA
jgi:myo-inositol 2-dehydrogenase / D-chiro-inositol 1-dehydrogenase